jgi:hypothetical protein
MKAVVKDRRQTLHCWTLAWILALTLCAQSNGTFGHNVLHHQTLGQFSAYLLYPLARFQWQKLTKKIKLLERRYYFIWIKINSVRSGNFSGSRKCKFNCRWLFWLSGWKCQCFSPAQFSVVKLRTVSDTAVRHIILIYSSDRDVTKLWNAILLCILGPWVWVLALSLFPISLLENADINIKANHTLFLVDIFWN